MPNNTVGGDHENQTVTKIRDITVPAPTNLDDGSVLTYIHSAGAYQLLSVSAISGASVTMGGDVTGSSAVSTVGKLQNKTVPAPSGGDNGKFLQYNSATSAFVFASTSGGTEADSSYFRQVGTSPFERYYMAGMLAAVSLVTVAGTVDVLKAFPFVSPRGGTLDRLAFAVTTGAAAGGVARCGIYSATSATNLYPNALVVDAGEVTTIGIGLKSQTISTALSAGTLYWFAFLAGTNQATIRAVNTSGNWPIFGYSNAFDSAGAANLDPGVGLTVALAYTTLPATFTASATIITSSSIPAIACRYSA